MSRVAIAVLVMAIVTYIPRVAPMALVQGRLKSRFLRSFLDHVPYAALGAMTFPAILYSTGNVASAVVGMVIALTMAYLERGLLQVAIGAIIAVYIVQCLM